MEQHLSSLIPASPSARVPLPLQIVLGLIALIAIVVPLLLVATHPRVVIHKRPNIVVSQRVVPKAELPPVEPVAFQDLAPADARAYNATVPFSTGPNPAARPLAKHAVSR